MNTKYNYLRQFVIAPNVIPRIGNNAFSLVDIKNIESSEKSLNFKFPDELKEFWLTIGEGRLISGKDGADLGFINYILPPDQIADILLKGGDSGYIIPWAREQFEEGDIPFFEIGDSTDFMFFKRFSDKPDAVYDFSGKLIEEHFERFIYRLYHESPDYYMKNW